MPVTGKLPKKRFFFWNLTQLGGVGDSRRSGGGRGSGEPRARARAPARFPVALARASSTAQKADFRRLFAGEAVSARRRRVWAAARRQRGASGLSWHLRRGQTSAISPHNLSRSATGEQTANVLRWDNPGRAEVLTAQRVTARLSDFRTSLFHFRTVLPPRLARQARPFFRRKTATFARLSSGFSRWHGSCYRVPRRRFSSGKFAIRTGPIRQSGRLGTPGRLL